jgi:hypothetical protein
VVFNPSSNPSNLFKGIVVTWCGEFEQASSFDGVVLNLQGPGFTYQAPDGSTINVPGCADDLTKGVYKNVGRVGNASITCKCWVYANGGTTDLAGAEFGPGSQLWYPTNRTWSFLNAAFETEAPPTTYQLQSWRELYE